MYALRRRHNPCLSPVTRAAWACQFSTALRVIRDILKIYHRNLKPSNLLVSGEGVHARLVIADFGACSGRTLASTTGSWKSTPLP